MGSDDFFLKRGCCNGVLRFFFEFHQYCTGSEDFLQKFEIIASINLFGKMGCSEVVLRYVLEIYGMRHFFILCKFENNRSLTVFLYIFEKIDEKVVQF